MTIRRTEEWSIRPDWPEDSVFPFHEFRGALVIDLVNTRYPGLKLSLQDLEALVVWLKERQAP